MRAIVLTGAPGAGKSSVAMALHDALGDDGVANALFEVDELERCYPAPARDVVLARMAWLARSHRDAGHDLIFVTATLETAAERHEVLTAIGADEAVVVLLQAPATELERRVRDREPGSWSGFEELVAASIRLAGEVADVPHDLACSTAGRDAEDVARELRAALALG